MSTGTTSEPPFRNEEREATTLHEESCPTCGRQTPHEVFIHLFVESRREENAAFSREPYRISVCQRCGRETVERVGGA